MRLLRKHLALIGFLVLPFLFAILAAEAAHHHDRLENSGHCALCVWQHDGSQAVSSPVPPVLTHSFLVMAVSTFVLSFFSFILLSPSGRAPPQILL